MDKITYSKSQFRRKYDDGKKSFYCILKLSIKQSFIIRGLQKSLAKPIWVDFGKSEFLNIYIFYWYKAICWDIFGFNKCYRLHYLLELLVQNKVSPNLRDTFTRLPWWTHLTINNISDQRTEHYFEVYDQTMEDLR